MPERKEGESTAPSIPSSLSDGKEKSELILGDRMSGDEVLLRVREPTERTMGDTVWNGELGDLSAWTAWTSEKGEVMREPGTESTSCPASDMASIELVVREEAE